jgi:subtilisin family serine protease
LFRQEDDMAIPTDTYFGKQWYLHNKYAYEYDLNVLPVWNDYTGKGVKIFVMDNGFDYTHPDLAANYDTDNDYDYGSGDDDAAPFYTDDNHGTAVAGIIGAARNGEGVVGVAYDATLIGARIDFNVTADGWRAEYVAALGDAVTLGAGVINMSFGATSDYSSYDGMANVALEKAAIIDAVSNGRDGLGIIMVKSAGNARSTIKDVNHDAIDGDTHQVIVAAVDRNGFVTEYSSFGSPVLISAFGSPYSGQIFTTDRQGTDGYNTAVDGDYTSSFNGTSAAAPMISGVVALLLEANPELGWRDVQSILAYSARHVGSGINGESLSGSERHLWTWNGATNWNGGALHHSADYGYGLVDALAAVRLAES